MLQEINQLRSIAESCRAGDPIDPRLASWLGSCLEEYLSRKVVHMDEAFGIRSPRGGVPWRMEEALRERDAALRALSRRMDSTMSVRARARAICEMARRYAASAWCFDRDRDDIPPSYAGTPKEQLWRAFQSGAPMPLGERRLRVIIGN
jgi:hypothetical protein